MDAMDSKLFAGHSNKDSASFNLQIKDTSVQRAHPFLVGFTGTQFVHHPVPALALANSQFVPEQKACRPTGSQLAACLTMTSLEHHYRYSATGLE